MHSRRFSPIQQKRGPRKGYESQDGSRDQRGEAVKIQLLEGKVPEKRNKRHQVGYSKKKRSKLEEVEEEGQGKSPVSHGVR